MIRAKHTITARNKERVTVERAVGIFIYDTFALSEVRISAPTTGAYAYGVEPFVEYYELYKIRDSMQN